MAPDRKPPISPATNNFYAAFVNNQKGLCEDNQPTGILRGAIDDELTKRLENEESLPPPSVTEIGESTPTVETLKLAYMRDFESLCNNPSQILTRRLVPNEFQKDILQKVSTVLKKSADYDRRKNILNDICQIAEKLNAGKVHLKRPLPDTRAANGFKDNQENPKDLGVIMGMAITRDPRFLKEISGLLQWLQDPKNVGP